MVPASAHLLASIEGLEERRARARLRREHKQPPPSENPATIDNLFDRADLVVLDYDLFWLGGDPASDELPSREAPRVTGEQLAYLVRCFSRCRYIVGLNQYGENPFDLNLRGHPESYADVNLGGDQIGNPGLWGMPHSGFRPWIWPNLVEAPALQEQRAVFVAEHSNSPVLSALGLVDSNGIPTVGRDATEFLGSGALEELTFQAFALSGRPRGLDTTDSEWEEGALARIAASRLAKWIERDVLSGQEALVDAPHVVERYPSLAGGAEAPGEAFDRTAQVRQVKDVSDLGLTNAALADASFTPSYWVSRPAWHWPRLVADKRISEVADPWEAESPEWRFCEDLSRFLAEDETLSYTADLASSFITRYVAGPQEISPAASSHPELYSGRHSLAGVVFTPQGVLEQ